MKLWYNKEIANTVCTQEVFYFAHFASKGPEKDMSLVLLLDNLFLAKYSNFHSSTLIGGKL